MNTSVGDLRWHKPLAYQEVNGNRISIACDYVRKGEQRLGFRLGGYDRAKPLVIDPQLIYSTYLGGSTANASDSGRAIAVDARGNAYVTGVAQSLDFPIKDAFQAQNGAMLGLGSNAFITKFDVNGKLVYSTYLGGSGFVNVGGPFPVGDYGSGIAVDAHGDVYVTGATASTDFPVKNAFQGSYIGQGTKAFVTKLDAAGNSLIYSTYLGGSGIVCNVFPSCTEGDVGTGIAVDAHGSAYVTGTTFSPDFPTENAFQNKLQADPAVPFRSAAFVTRFDASGRTLVYSTYLGGSNGSGDGAAGIAVDAHGNAYVTGTAVSSNFPTKNAFQDKPRGSPHECGAANRFPCAIGSAFVTKFCPRGTLVYSTYLGGSGVTMTDTPGGDSGAAIAVDNTGHAYVTGSTSSTDFPTKNALQDQNNSSCLGTEYFCTNAFVAKFDVDGDSLIYSTYLGGSSSDTARSIALNRRDQVYVTGSSHSIDFPVKNAFEEQNQSAICIANPAVPICGPYAFVTKIDAADRALVYSSYLGGGDGFGIAVDLKGDAYVTGQTGSTDFPTKNAFQNSLRTPVGTGTNAFVTKISAH